MKRASKKKDSRHLKKSERTWATKERILVVNDDEPIREAVSSMLTSSGSQCRTAADGLEALALLDSGEDFELLLTNLMMPNLDGLGLLARTKETFPDMPVVIESGAHDIFVAFAAIRNGAYDYLMEPFEQERLLNVVRRALESSPPEVGKPRPCSINWM
jgi:two-component system, NtrC family, response regulator AtoC